MRAHNLRSGDLIMVGPTSNSNGRVYWKVVLRSRRDPRPFSNDWEVTLYDSISDPSQSIRTLLAANECEFDLVQCCPVT